MVNMRRRAWTTHIDHTVTSRYFAYFGCFPEDNVNMFLPLKVSVSNSHAQREREREPPPPKRTYTHTLKEERSEEGRRTGGKEGEVLCGMCVYARARMCVHVY